MKAGKYFIGDPCYAIRNEDWMEYLYAGGFDGGVFDFNEIEVYCDFTAYGDGEYEDQDGNPYSVDAGLIGATPLDNYTPKYSEDELNRLGRVVTLPEDFEPDANFGVFDISGIVINTADEEYDY